MSNQQTELDRYVQREDSSARWEWNDKRSTGTTTDQTCLYEGHLVSQTWRSHRWSHGLRILLPDPIPTPLPIYLYITGSIPTGRDLQRAEHLAAKTGYGVAVLDAVPNQPFFGGLREDALIAHTFDAFLDSGDPEWPLLLPMTRSAVEAMNALDDLIGSEIGEQPSGYVVGGASKRGWTSWLTAAVDERVHGLIPMVFDNLHFRKQLQHQIDTWGTYSEQINDYIERELDRKLDSERGEQLLHMTDPYHFRNRINMPRLIVSATNDTYWTLDANNLYVEDLPGYTHQLYLPNTGHGLERHTNELPGTIGSALLGFDDRLPLPRFSSSVTMDKHQIDGTIAFQHGPEPEEAQLWWAESEHGDFRAASWASREMHRPSRTEAEFRLSRPDRSVGLFGQMVYNVEDRIFTLSTRIHICHG